MTSQRLPTQSTVVATGARRGMLTVATLGWFLIAMCAFGLSPLYPEVARDLGTAPDELGVVLGISSLVSALLQLPTGVLADRSGVRRFLVLGVLCAASAAVLRGLAPGLAVFALGQVAIGIAMPTFQAGSITGVANAYPLNMRAAAISYLYSAFSLGQVSSVLLFGLIGGIVGWRDTSLGLAILPLLVMPLILGTPEPPRDMRNDKSIISETVGGVRFLLHRRMLVLTAIWCLPSVALTANVFLLPFILREAGIGAAATSALLVANIVGAILGAPIMGHLAGRLGPRRPVVGGLVLSGASIVALVLLGPQPAVVALSFLMLGLGVGGVPGIIQSQVVEEAGHLHIGTGAALGGMRLTHSLVQSLGPLIAGTVFVRAGASTAQLATAAALALATLLAFWISSRRKESALPPVSSAVFTGLDGAPAPETSRP